MTQGTDPASVPTALADCPRHPNCVSSQARAAANRVEPFPCIDSCEATLGRLRAIIERTRGATVVTATDRYLRAKISTPVFRFVDDLELLVDDEKQVIHVRSASRIGSWDFGVNRRRVEALRRRLAEAES